MFYYIVDYTALFGKIDEEVSRIADTAYSDQGVSLYDEIVITRRDYDVVMAMMNNALSSIVNRCKDICLYSPTAVGSTETMRLAFYVPDFEETSNGDAVRDELSRFIAYASVAQFFTQRHPASVPEYTDRAQAALTKAVSLLKTRKAPLESWT